MISFLPRGIAVFVCVLLFLFGDASALEGESIVFNPTTGNYQITYLNSDDGKFHQVTFIPATKINLTFNSKHQLEQDGIVHYGHSLISGWDSQQVVIDFQLDPVSSVTTPTAIPLNPQAKQVAIENLGSSKDASLPTSFVACLHRQCLRYAEWGGRYIWDEHGFPLLFRRQDAFAIGL